MPIPVPVPPGPLPITDSDTANAESLLASFAQVIHDGTSGSSLVTPALLIPGQVNPGVAGGVPTTLPFSLDKAETQLMFRQLFLALVNKHQSLRQLIHLADGGGPFEGFTSGAYLELLPSGNPFPTSATWWESAAKLKKIVEETVTYNSNMTIATQQWKAYNTDGITVLSTVTDTVTYSGVVELSRTRTIT